MPLLNYWIYNDMLYELVKVGYIMMWWYDNLSIIERGYTLYFYIICQTITTDNREALEGTYVPQVHIMLVFMFLCLNSVLSFFSRPPQLNRAIYKVQEARQNIWQWHYFHDIVISVYKTGKIYCTLFGQQTM